MNPTFGASILSWIPPMWTPEGGLFAIRKATIETTRIEGDLFSQPSPRSAYSFLSQESDLSDQGGAG